MLPTINLQISDIATFNIDIKAPVALPDLQTTLKAEFADLLQSRFDAAAEQGFPIGQNLPPGGSQLPPEPETSIPVTIVELEMAADAQDLTPLLDPGIVEAVVPARSDPSSVPDFPIQAAISQAALIQNPTLQSPLGEASAARPTLIAQMPANTGPVLPTAVPLSTGSMPDPSRPPVDASAMVTTRETGSQLQASPPGLPIITDSSPMSRRERETAVVTQNPKELMAKFVPGPENNNSKFQQQYPIRTSLPDSGLGAPAPQAAVLRSSIGGIPEQELTSRIKPSAVTTQTVNLISTTGSLQISQSPMLSLAAASDSPTPTSASQPIGIPVQLEAWGEKISERVLLMAGNQLNSASIRLTPAELGPLQIKVSIEDGAANVMFHAQHATTREALEMALPRLREMLGENGITLGQTNIGEQGVSQGKRDGHTEAPIDSWHVDHEPVENTVAEAATRERRSSASNSLVDTFA